MIRKILLIYVFMFSYVFAFASDNDRFPDLRTSSVISMVTVFPGNEVYSLFGHSSFRVYDPVSGIDWMFNYGTFDFHDPLFVPRFVKGQLDYYLSIDDFQGSLRFYSENEGRKVVEQVLDLNFEEKRKVYNFLIKNSLPENRYYKYDFIFDNCSTRIADVLVQCFGSDVKFPEGEGNESYRQMIDSYLDSYPLLDAGIELVLGSPSDKNPVGTQKFFLPVPMIEGFDNAVLVSEGREKKLVTENRILSGIEKSTYSSDNIIRNYFLSGINNYLFYIFLILFLFELSSLIFKKQNNITYKIFTVINSCLEIIYLLFASVCGFLLFYLWFLSDHIVPNWNFHLLWLSPLSAVYLISLISGRLKTVSVFIARLLFVCSILFIPIILTSVQSLSFTYLPLYLFTVLLYFKKIRNSECRYRLF